jgi:hypothetical protein
MAKAHLTTKNGTKIVIEGTPEEVAGLVARFDDQPDGSKKGAAKKSRQSRAKTGPVGLVGELIDANFFKKPKGLGAIKLALEEQGHFYPVTTLSPILLGMVKKRTLRRVKDNKRWLYVGYVG